MSVEFSGQRMKSGIGASPSRAFTIRLMVSLRWLLVTDRIRPSASIPRPGTLPCTMPTRTEPAVAEAAQRDVPQAGAQQRQHDDADADRDQPAAGGRIVTMGQQQHDRVRDALRDQGDAERDAGDADQRQEAGQGRVHGRVREADPAEPAERDPGVEELEQGPAQRSRQRPPAQRRSQVEGEPEQAEEQGLEGDQQDRDPAAEDVDPADRDTQQAQPVEEPDPERRPARPGGVAVADEQGEGGDPDQQQRPETVRLPGEPGEHAGQDSGQAAEPAVVAPGEAIGGVDRCRIEHIGTGGGHPEILLAGTSGDGMSLTAVNGGEVRVRGPREVSGQPSAPSQATALPPDPSTALRRTPGPRTLCCRRADRGRPVPVTGAKAEPVYETASDGGLGWVDGTWTGLAGARACEARMVVPRPTPDPHRDPAQTGR